MLGSSCRLQNVIAHKPQDLGYDSPVWSTSQFTSHYRAPHINIAYQDNVFLSILADGFQDLIA